LNVTQALGACLRRITRLELRNVVLEDPDKLWANVTNLRHITVYGMPLTSEVITRLLFLPELKGLELGGSGYRGEPLAKVGCQA
jgi:hypothetical protein